jgi:hypothetical protein
MTISQAHYGRLVALGRDEMMTAWLKAQERAPNEAQQRSAAERFAGFMQEIIPQIVGVVATGDYPAFAVKLDNIDGKGKIALKAVDVDKAGPALITRLGATLTLVMADAEQFDQDRPPAGIQLDEPPLPLDASPADDEFAEEMAEIAEGENLLFTAVEDEECHLPDGTVIKPWSVVHGTADAAVEVFTPIDAEAFVLAAVDHLNRTAVELDRDMTPAEVRAAVLGVLAVRQEGFGVAFHPPYADGETVQDNTPGEDAPVKRGPKTGAEKVAAYFAGFDGADSDLTDADCPHERGKLRDMWVDGLTDAKGGKGARFQRPAGSRSAFDAGRSAYAAGEPFLSADATKMDFQAVGAWRKGWKAAEAEALPVSAPANDAGGLESTGNVAA